MIHAGHFCGFSADQRAAGLTASFSDAFDNGRSLGDVERPGSEVIEEEQRLGTLDDEVVDAHGDQIDADGIVDACFDGDAKLGADAVIGGNQNRVGKPCGLEIEQAAKAADFPIGAGAAG